MRVGPGVSLEAAIKALNRQLRADGYRSDLLRHESFTSRGEMRRRRSFRARKRAK